MVDTVDAETRSRIMSRVRSKDTAPEVALRKALFARGLRYRLHDAALPGKPDLVSARYKAVVFVHGCQWHWHGCSRSRMPATNTDYWRSKIARNQVRDQAHIAELLAHGWRVLVVWECAVKSRALDATADKAIKWLRRNGKPAVRYIEPSPSISRP